MLLSGLDTAALAARYPRGRALPAMSIPVPSFRWSDQRRRGRSELVRRGAAGLSERLGHRPAPRRAALA